MDVFNDCLVFRQRLLSIQRTNIRVNTGHARTPFLKGLRPSFTGGRGDHFPGELCYRPRSFYAWRPVASVKLWVTPKGTFFYFARSLVRQILLRRLEFGSLPTVHRIDRSAESPTEHRPPGFHAGSRHRSRLCAKTYRRLSTWQSGHYRQSVNLEMFFFLALPLLNLLDMIVRKRKQNTPLEPANCRGQSYDQYNRQSFP